MTVRKEHEDFRWYSRPAGKFDSVAEYFPSPSRNIAFAGFYYIEGDWVEGFPRMPGEAKSLYRAIVVPC
jgi:hypothetical protein